MLGRYQLAACYASLRAAVRGGRWPEASQWLQQALGMELPGRPDAAAVAEAAQRSMTAQLSYRGFKPAELAMVAYDLKPVTKLEDLPLAMAQRLIAQQGAQRRIVLGPTYTKDYLLLRSTPCAADAPAALVCAYVAARDRPEAAAAVAALESAAREDAIEAARWLDIPHCCAEAFVADFARSRDDQDTLNDDACRRMLRAVPPSGRPWWSNPLSDHELLGFYPCRADCPQAAERALRNLAALARSRPHEAERARRRLGRSVLYLRLPFFAVLEGEPLGDGALRLSGFRVNRFGEATAAAIQALFAAHVRPLLQAGSVVEAQSDGVEVRSGAQKVRLCGPETSAAPLLVSWRNDDGGR